MKDSSSAGETPMKPARADRVRVWRWFFPTASVVLLAAVIIGFAPTFYLRPLFATRPMPAYLYASDVEAYRTELLADGVQAGVVEYPFWAPRGEFRIEDPDGYVVMVTHT